MTDTAPFGILLIGGAHTHQENYAPAFAADPRCRLIGLTDEPNLPLRRQGLNLRLAAALDVPYLEDLDEALGREDVHAVCLCAEPERRGRLAVRAARAGKHLYIDKPLAASVADVRAVVSAVEEAGVVCQMFSLVRIPLAERARQIVASGRLGKLIGLHCELLFAKGRGGTANLSRPRRESPQAERFTFIDSKRELYCVGLYPLVLFGWLTGESVTNVFAITSNFFFAEHQQNNVEDFATVSMRLSGGIDATITVGRTGWSSHPASGIHQLHLIGTEGSETIDAFRPRLETYSDVSPWTQPEHSHPEDPMGFWSSSQREVGAQPKSSWHPVDSAVASDASHFVDCLETGQPSDVPAALGAHAVEVILAAYESAAENRAVDLPRPAVQ